MVQGDRPLRACLRVALLQGQIKRNMVVYRPAVRRPQQTTKHGRLCPRGGDRARQGTKKPKQYKLKGKKNTERNRNTLLEGGWSNKTKPRALLTVLGRGFGSGAWGAVGCVPLAPPPSPALLAWVAFPGPFTFFCLPCLLFSFLDFTSARVRVRGFPRFCVPCSAGAYDGTLLMGNTLLQRFAHTGSMVSRCFFGVAGPSTTSVDSGLSRWLCHAGGFLSNALKAGSRKAGFFIL